MSKLYLIPNVISQDNIWSQLPGSVIDIIEKLNHYIVEDIRTARRYIKSVYKEKNIDEVTFYELNEHTSDTEISVYIQPLKKGIDMGLISEAGVPCVADPGAVVVALAHQNNIDVVPLVGPSSILLALMSSGLNGQQFCFHGYLPIPKNERIQKIKLIEKEAHIKNQTQIFIETPYRNNQLLHDILATCADNTKLCIASEIMSDQSLIKTKYVKEWKTMKTDFHKQTAVFLLGK